MSATFNNNVALTDTHSMARVEYEDDSIVELLAQVPAEQDLPHHFDTPASPHIPQPSATAGQAGQAPAVCPLPGRSGMTPTPSLILFTSCQGVSTMA